MKKKDKPIKYNNETKFTVVREIIINDVKDPNGHRYIQKAHVEDTPNQNKDFELGSVRKPKNKDVVEMRWDIPSKEKINPFKLFQN